MLYMTRPQHLKHRADTSGQRAWGQQPQTKQPGCGRVRQVLSGSDPEGRPFRGRVFLGCDGAPVTFRVRARRALPCLQCGQQGSGRRRGPEPPQFVYAALRRLP